MPSPTIPSHETSPTSQAGVSQPSVSQAGMDETVRRMIEGALPCTSLPAADHVKPVMRRAARDAAASAKRKTLIGRAAAVGLASPTAHVGTCTGMAR